MPDDVDVPVAVAVDFICSLLCRFQLQVKKLSTFMLNIWNSLPVHVVNSSSVNSFKNNLDRFWSNQEMYYNFRCDITGTGNRSLSQN